jgi:GTP-binding protein
MHYQNATFVISAARLDQLPEDTGIEVAFAGRSNAGKSSCLNVLCNQKGLAKTSKTPGRTQLINLFDIGDNKRLVDLPGYGFAKVSTATKRNWQKTLNMYLQSRTCLKGVVLLMDSRHPLKELDCTMIQWAIDCKLTMLILLTKTDKLNNQEKSKALRTVKAEVAEHADMHVQLFSSLKRTGLNELMTRLNGWFGE